MESIRNIYRIGNGPSSSHTMGPRKAAEIFSSRYPRADKYSVELYGSLAATGRGHLTDVAVLSVLEPQAPTEIIWSPHHVEEFHTNGMKFTAMKDGAPLGEWTAYSIGGGSVVEEGGRQETPGNIYPLTDIAGIQQYCEEKGCNYWEYVMEHEDQGIMDYLAEVWDCMCATIERGLQNEGVLPGGLGVRRKAASYFVKAKGYTDAMRNRGLLYAYALATSEENASGGIIITAPTCGSSGVLPAVLYHLYTTRDFMRVRILRALATAGLFGNVVKHNASVSGAEVGCQGEIGVACAMAAAAACQLFGGTPAQIEYAAELALEHHLGLTCDPVCGLVQIPCIERNAIAAARAFDSNIFATFSDGKHRVSFDRVVAVMKETGHDIPSLYKETAEGGLAKKYE